MGDSPVRSSSSLKESPARSQLRKLQRDHPFLAQPTHVLYQRLVKVCEEQLAAGDEDAAQGTLLSIKEEADQEVHALRATFDMLKPSDPKRGLSKDEVKRMLEYFHFPSSDEDVERLLSAVDHDHDGCMSFKEFTVYAGRMGGSRQLFEIRRQNVAKKEGVELSGESEGVPIEELKLAGFAKPEQTYWSLVLPRAHYEFKEAAKLVDCQRNALKNIRGLAKKNHEAKLDDLQRRVQGMHFNENDLWMTLAYIRELAPVLVHVHLDKMIEHMEKDTHYRNQFETSKSGGLLNTEVRKRWEKDLFAGSYDDADGFQRPKYGVLNTMNDYRGVVGCKQYGVSYLVLKDVRLRCTFSPEDSANLKADRLAVLDYYAHVLSEFSNDELVETIKIAKNSEAAVLGDSSKIGKMKYKETQIHGEIRWDTHVERLVAHESHRASMGKRLEEMCKKNGWKLSWMDQEQARMKSEEAEKLGEEAWKAKLKAIMEKVPDVEGVEKGYCKKGCGRPVQPGKTQAGNDFSTCCRGCALGFGHSLTCGCVNPELLGPGLCINGCGKPVNPGRSANGKAYITCCKGCAYGSHDSSCGQEAPPVDSDRPMCKFNCGRKVAPPSGRRKFDTCCRGCATSTSDPRSHSATCLA